MNGTAAEVRQQDAQREGSQRARAMLRAYGTLNPVEPWDELSITSQVKCVLSDLRCVAADYGIDVKDLV